MCRAAPSTRYDTRQSTRAINTCCLNYTALVKWSKLKEAYIAVKFTYATNQLHCSDVRIMQFDFRNWNNFYIHSALSVT